MKVTSGEDRWEASTHSRCAMSAKLCNTRSICVCVCMYVFVRVHVCVNVRAGLYADKMIRVYAYVCVRVREGLCVCECVATCMCLSVCTRRDVIGQVGNHHQNVHAGGDAHTNITNAQPHTHIHPDTQT